MIGPEETPPVGEEWFDVVDESDRVIGRERRVVVHRDRLRHRAVHLLVQNAAGEVFLQKRSRHKDLAAGQWDSSASGHLDVGETYEAAVIREALEELGFELPAPPREIGRFAACRDTGEEFVRVYHARTEGPFTLHPDEIERGEWVTLERLEAWLGKRPEDFARSFRYLWERTKAALGASVG
ncbi:MAG: NUDIX hydrolase [Opitutales bacterium]